LLLLLLLLLSPSLGRSPAIKRGRLLR
jgi:hypothetical protein